jgi:hypothetical protein
VSTNSSGAVLDMNFVCSSLLPRLGRDGRSGVYWTLEYWEVLYSMT